MANLYRIAVFHQRRTCRAAGGLQLTPFLVP
jgi:hypothetical protein